MTSEQGFTSPNRRQIAYGEDVGSWRRIERVRAAAIERAGTDVVIPPVIRKIVPAGLPAVEAEYGITAED